MIQYLYDVSYIDSVSILAHPGWGHPPPRIRSGSIWSPTNSLGYEVVVVAGAAICGQSNQQQWCGVVVVVVAAHCDILYSSHTLVR